jgi:uncharacterized membrane protein affecting hemolysin expression
MKIELDDNSSITLVIAILAALLALVALNARACSVNQNEQLTARCKALIESKADPVTINSTCGKISQ